MTLLAVPIMVKSVDQALAAAAQAAEHGADLVEFRLDRLPPEVPLDSLGSLVERSPLPSIVTCRLQSEGGHFAGSEDCRLARLHAALHASRPPVYIDVELAAYEQSASFHQALDSLLGPPANELANTTGLILSYHDFKSRPPDLYQRLEAMAAAPHCRVAKVAWHARSLRDNLEAFEILLRRQKPTIALCMGPFGLPSRVLAKKFGALLTFASLDNDQATAPGQPSVTELKKLFRWDAVGPDTRVYGVIGYPVGHSLSPLVHNAGFTHTGFDGVYLPLPIPPEYEHFKATVSSWLDLPQLHFQGASVTIPHKENLLRFVRERGGEIEPLAERIGAANTLCVRPDGSLYASNTDYAAALSAVCDRLGIAPDALAGQQVAVIGAGGAARAIVAGFAQHGANVTIYNRTLQRAEDLAAEFSNPCPQNPRAGKVTAASLEKVHDSCCQVYINCTPIGMHPNVHDSPITETSSMRCWGPGTVVFDTIYNPVHTRLLRQARAAGCLTIPGTEMFLRQAAAQFTLWTSQDAPVAVFQRLLMDHLAESFTPGS
ncbi:MAG: shikimate dehydrogenase [Phycisphaeraceae bacterium]|nr:shikimate dehydrogenase [Phycisphaeraceae bacterium]